VALCVRKLGSTLGNKRGKRAEIEELLLFIDKNHIDNAEMLMRFILKMA
jgi:hypothetical protein